MLKRWVFKNFKRQCFFFHEVQILTISSMFCFNSSPKYSPCSIKSGLGRLVSQELIHYIQQVLLKLMLLATVLIVIMS